MAYVFAPFLVLRIVADSGPTSRLRRVLLRNGFDRRNRSVALSRAEELAQEGRHLLRRIEPRQMPCVRNHLDLRVWDELAHLFAPRW